MDAFDFSNETGNNLKTIAFKINPEETQTNAGLIDAQNVDLMILEDV